MKKSLIFFVSICIFSVTFSSPNRLITRSITSYVNNLMNAARDAGVSGVPMFDVDSTRNRLSATLFACTTVSSLGRVQNHHVPRPLFLALYKLHDRLREQPTLDNVSGVVKEVLKNSEAF